MSWQEEMATAPSDPPPDGTRQREENRCDNQPDKRRESGGTRGDGNKRGKSGRMRARPPYAYRDLVQSPYAYGD